MALKLGESEAARAEYEALLLPGNIELSAQQQAAVRCKSVRAPRSASPARGCPQLRLFRGTCVDAVAGHGAAQVGRSAPEFEPVLTNLSPTRRSQWLGAVAAGARGRAHARMCVRIARGRRASCRRSFHIHSGTVHRPHESFVRFSVGGSACAVRGVLSIIIGSGLRSARSGPETAKRRLTVLRDPGTGLSF